MSFPDPCCQLGTEGIFITTEEPRVLDSESWVRVDQELPHLDQEARIRTADLMGQVAVSDAVEVMMVPEIVSETTLLADIQLAALGDPDARQRISINVGTDMGERLFKVQDQSEVDMEFVNGELEQGGRKLKDVHRNTLENMPLNPVMLGYTNAELRNAHLFELLHEADIFETHSAVVFSCAPTDVQTLQDYRFFEGTLSCSVQLLQAEGNQAQLQTALVAGKRSPKAERHDVAAITQMAANEGLELFVDKADDMVQFMVLIPKEQAKNGVCDVVSRLDDAARTVTGEEVFYGQSQPRQEYLAHAQMCRKRHEQFGPTIELITSQLIREAATFRNPLDAIKRLDELSEAYGVDRAIYDDTTIDAHVFGAKSAALIHEARNFAAKGQIEQAHTAAKKAREVADSSSCPLFKGDEGNDNKDDNNESSEKKWMNCPFCQARVFDDPCATSLKCWDCHAHVSDGRVVSEGDGGSSKRRQEMRQRAMERVKRRQEMMQRAMEHANLQETREPK